MDTDKLAKLRALQAQDFAAPTRKKPCCVCKATKRLRDQCLRNNEEQMCFEFVLAHKVCLKAKGYNVIM
jgi:hypothetical protein